MPKVWYQHPNYWDLYSSMSSDPEFGECVRKYNRIADLLWKALPGFSTDRGLRRIGRLARIFNDVAHKYAEYGASDTEPRATMAEIVDEWARAHSVHGYRIERVREWFRWWPPTESDLVGRLP